MRKLITICSLLFASITVNAQYCIPAPGTDGCTDGDMIDNFILFGESGTSIINVASGCSPNAFADLTAQSVSLGQNTTYTATISTQFIPDDNVAIWIDFNNNDIFDNTELVGTQSNISLTGSPVAIVVPSGAPLGNHRMRVSLRYDIIPTDIDPCNTGINASDFGEAHDYTVNIVPPPTCPAPTNLATSGITQNSVTLSWNGSASLYGIEYGPAGFIPGTGTYTTSSSVSTTISGLTSASNYTAYVRALCTTTDSSMVASVNFSTLCGNVNPPYTQNFDGVTIPAIPACMTVEDANGDMNTWMTQDFIFSSAPNALIYGSDGMQNANDWIFTPGINVVAGNAYQVSFAYATEGSAPESLEVKAGTAALSTAMASTVYFTSTSLQNTNFLTATFTYTAATTGTVYFGWHLFSDLNSFGLALDDISITQTTTTVCDTSLTLTASSVTANAATINWSAVTGATGYQYVLDQIPGNPTSGTPTTATSFPATGLLPNTTYYFHLRTACTSGFSVWRTISFTTAPVSVTNMEGNGTAISVYPNPVTHTAVVEVSAVAENATLQLTDISGRVLQSIPVTGKKTVVDMTKFAVGIYIIRYDDNVHSQLLKVVKQ